MQQLNQPAVIRDTHARTDALDMQILPMTACLLVHKQAHFLICAPLIALISAQLLLVQTKRFSDTHTVIIGVQIITVER